MVRSRRGHVSVLLHAVAAAVVSILAALGLATQAHAQSPPACTPNTVVQTMSGPVCGLTFSGQTNYLDIPYAAPPVGRLRWRPPQPVQPWTSVHSATQRGAACPTPGFAGAPPQAGTSEDCLTLEVQRPANVPAGNKLPVMFEIHGGGFIGEALTDNGTNFVSTGPVVYVYVKYRLGILGFLAEKALGAHSGDYGLQDQQAALRWVKSNIARFGGDPNKVTIFGESAGGASVCDQVASPTAKGLFQRGISVSGFYNYNVNTIWWPADCKSKLLTEKQAQNMGTQFAAKVGCGHAADVAACLRAVPVNTLLEKAGQIENVGAGGAIGPIVNGTTLPMSAAEAFRRGRVNHVKLMIGVGRDEFNGGVYTNTPAGTVVANTAAQYRQLVRQQFGSRARTVMRLYPLRRFPAPAPFIAYRTIMADAFSVCPAVVSDRRLGKHIPVYAYEDDDADSPIPVGQSLPVPGSPTTPETPATQPLGAFHSGINHLAHDPSDALDPNQAALQNQVLAEWTGFALTDNPNVANTPPWLPYTRHHPALMSYRPAGDSTLTPTRTISREHNCGFWNALNRTAPWAQ
jgi:para-nitrobenzyl esterase